MSKFDRQAHNKRIASLRGNDWREALRLAKAEQSKYHTKIKKARYLKKLTQEELMSRAGIAAKSTLSRIETGKTTVSEKTAKRLSKALGVSMNRIFSKKGERYKIL